MNYMKKKKFFIYLSLLIIAFIFLGAAVIYSYYQDKKVKEDNQKKAEQIENEIRTSEKQAEQEVTKEGIKSEEEPSNTNQEIEEQNQVSFTKYKAELKDVRGKESKGEAIASFSEGNYGLVVNFENLEDPTEKRFYEGWLVRKKPYRVLSTGKLEKVNDKFVNKFSSKEDLAGYELYVTTLEPDDNDPKPAEHVMEGEFSKIMDENEPN